MPLEALTSRLASLRASVARLQRRGSGPEPAQALLIQTFQELENSWEELKVIEESLREEGRGAVRRLAADTPVLADLFEFAPDPYLATDLHGTISRANLAAGVLLGVPPESLPGKLLTSFVRLSDREPFRHQLNDLPNHESVHEWLIRLTQSRDGTVTAAVRTTLIRDRVGTPVGLRWILRDVTQHLRAAEVTNFQARVLAQVSDAVVAINGQGAITYWNEAAAGLYGIASKDALGRKLETAYRTRWATPEDEVAAQHELAASGTWRGENMHLTRDGRTLHVESSVSTIRDAGGENLGLLAVIRDITERKQSEAERRRLHELAECRASELEAVIDSIGDGIYIGGPDGITRCNRAGLEMLGATSLRNLQQRPGELAAKFAVRWPDNGRRLAEHELQMNRALRGEQVVEEVLATRADTGEDVYLRTAAAPVRQHGAIVAAVVINSDITRRKRAEEAAQTQRERLRVALDHVPIILFNQDLALRYVWVRNTISREPEDIIGKTDHDLVGPEDAARLLEIKRGVLETGQPHHSEWTLPIKGTLRTLDVRFEALRDAKGVIVGLTGAAFDITQRKQAEDALQRSKEDLERVVAQRTAALEARAGELTRSNVELERLAYVASHDLQEPLRTITNFAQLLQRRYQSQLGAEADEFIGYVVSGVERMHALIADLLTYSRARVEPLQLEPVDLGLVLKEVQRSLEPVLTKTEAILSLPAAFPCLAVDEVQMHQLFENLLDNALKFRRPDVTPEVRITAECRENRWEFCVADNGIGVPTEYHELIFTLFKRLHSRAQFPGTGVGLAICQRIVERHGGRIWVESVLGEGSRFYFTLLGRDHRPEDRAGSGTETGQGLGSGEAQKPSWAPPCSR